MNKNKGRRIRFSYKYDFEKNATVRIPDCEGIIIGEVRDGAIEVISKNLLIVKLDKGLLNYILHEDATMVDR
jgi:hypothetical protein